MPTNDDNGWASWLQQFLPQVGAPQPGNILNSPAAGPSAGRLGLPRALGGAGLYTAPPGQPGAPQPGAPMPIGMPPGPMDPSIMANMAAMRGQPAGGASGAWTPSPAAPSTAAPGSGQLGGATGSWGPSAGAPMSGAAPNTSPSGAGISMPARPYTPTPAANPAASNVPWPNQIDPTGTWGPTRTAPGRPAPVASAPAGALAQNSPFVQIARPNAPAGGAAQGQGGPPMMTALDLSRLFGRRA
jgi:hypothetical protein